MNDFVSLSTMKKLTDLQVQRFDLRASLWNNRHQVPSENFFGRVLVLSHSLTDCLLQLTTQNRTVSLNFEDEKKSVTEALEKIDFIPAQFGGLENFVRAAQPYLRSTVICGGYESTVHLCDQHVKSQPRLRSIEMYIYNEQQESRIVKSKVFHKFGPQLESFTYVGIKSFALISSVDKMCRLKKFKIIIHESSNARNGPQDMERIIPWHQLTDFTFQCEYSSNLLECAQLLDQLGEMTQLRKLSIKLSFVQYDEPDLLEHSPESVLFEEIRQFLTVKLTTIPKFSKLEVLSFNVRVIKELDSILGYRFMLGLLVPKLGAALTKLVFYLPITFESTSYCIFLDYSNDFPHLETLVLDYQSNNDAVFLRLYDCDQDKRTSSQSIRKLTIANFEEGNFSSNEICRQIPDIFPNLVELNFKANHWYFQCQSFADQEVMKMISRLPRLCTLCFIDDHPKFAVLVGSIELMCKRAVELKPKVPMLFRVPLNDDFKTLKYAADQLPDKMKQNFYCWDKAARWIRLC